MSVSVVASNRMEIAVKLRYFIVEINRMGRSGKWRKISEERICGTRPI